MPEIHELALLAVYVPCKGEVDAWDNDDLVETVRATGRNTLIMAGVCSIVCVMFWSSVRSSTYPAPHWRSYHRETDCVS